MDYCATVDKMGIATPTPTKTRAAGMWNENTVNRILTSEVYAGIWRYGKAVGNKRMGGERHIENQHCGSAACRLSRGNFGRHTTQTRAQQPDEQAELQA